jgi:restriction endonuclease Mrr
MWCVAAVVTLEKIAHFETLFRTPTIDGMIALDPSDFEHFVAYVFNCAGYTVEYIADAHFPYGPGVDLNLYSSLVAKKPLARVEVKRYAPGNRVSYDEAKGFNGVLHHGETLPGYFVTTSDFHANARTFAEDTHGRLRLLNGEQLLRYITYLGGSRVSDPNGLQRTPALTPPDWL